MMMMSPNFALIKEYVLEAEEILIEMLTIKLLDLLALSFLQSFSVNFKDASGHSLRTLTDFPFM